MKIDVEMKAVYKAGTSPVKAVAVVILDDSFVIHNVKIVDIGGRSFPCPPGAAGTENGGTSATR